MIQEFNREEKMALIAVTKYIISADGIVTDSEINRINELAEEKGFEDFQSIYNDVDKEVASLEDLKKLILMVKDDSHRKGIVRYALKLSRADANLNPDEVDILNYMGSAWDIDINSILKR